MAVPKHKTSKQRKHSRAANWKIATVSLTECSQCHAKKLSHQVCKACGFYDGKSVVAIKAKKAD